MKKILPVVLVSFLLFIIDRALKSIILKIPVEGIFLSKNIDFKLYFNEGIAFSLPLPNALSIILSIIISILLIGFFIKFFKQKQFYLLMPIALIFIGAISNLIDRLRFGAVVDLISFYIWPAFNLADCYIVVGIFWLILSLKHYSAEASKTVTGTSEAKQDVSK